MPATPPPIRAVALISGGLDSLLAARLIQEQGVLVEGLNFFTGFCVEGHTHAIRQSKQKKVPRNQALFVAEQLGIKLHIIDVVEPYKDVVLNPKHGYGANLNPCLDCKCFMLAQAENWRREHGFDFIITGEVVGQRPMSQRKDTMPLVQRESCAGDRLLRPLCAQNLPATLPEREGWINREQLKGFSGRSRKPQMALAADFGLDDYAQPAGGCCFLTDPNYSQRLQDLWRSRQDRDYELDDLMLLKVGRHVRPHADYKLIIGREDGENRFMRGYHKTYDTLYANSHNGPLALVVGRFPDDDSRQLAARIVARYGQGRNASEVNICHETTQGQQTELKIKPLPTDAIPSAWLL